MKKLFLRAIILPVFLLAGFFVFNLKARAADIIISEDAVWESGSVKTIIIDQNAGETGIIIMPGVTLTIKPGVAVKFGENAGALVVGNLIVEGDSQNPVVFTSLKDDHVGGDTNDDGAATNPTPGDWRGFFFAVESESKIDYATFKYGGGSDGGVSFLILLGNDTYLSISHANIINNMGFILNSSPNLKINYANIYNPDFCANWDQLNLCGLMIINSSPSPPDFTNNYWGGVEGPIFDYPDSPDVKNTVILGEVAYQPFLTEPWQTPARPDPVILIPGILGSWQVGGEWRIDPIRHTYDNLIEAMTQAGYKLAGEDRNLFLFPYDWKVNNMLTADLLKEKISEVKDVTGNAKVDIVAHSMGGLVTRAYIEDNDYNNDVDQMIFLGTPHLGAPEVYLRYEGGEFTREGKWFYKRFFQLYALSNGYTDLVEYIREQVPTVEQLLPIYDYLKEKNNGDWQFRPYYENYPRNTFLEFLNLPDRIEKLKQGAVITNIVSGASAVNTSTIQFIRVVNDPNPNDNKWPHGYPENFEQSESAFEMGAGDGTVPFNSANGLNGVEVIEVANDEHGALPTTRQQDIIEILTGERPTEYYDNETLYAVKRWLIMALFSPADLIVTVPDGQRVGKDFLNGSVINEIAGAFYSGFDQEHLELVAIPNPSAGEYRLELEGVGEGGNYKLFVGLADDENSAGNQEFTIDSAIMAGKTDQFILTYQSGSTTPATLEANVDFAKLKDIVKSLYGAKEIKKKLVYQHLMATFDLLEKKSEKFDKIENNKNIPRILSAFLKLRLRLLLQKLDFYQHQNLISEKAKNILDSNINLLINKL